MAKSRRKPIGRSVIVGLLFGGRPYLKKTENLANRKMKPRGMGDKMEIATAAVFSASCRVRRRRGFSIFLRGAAILKKPWGNLANL